MSSKASLKRHGSKWSPSIQAYSYPGPGGSSALHEENWQLAF